MNSSPITIQFPGVSPDLGNEYAEGLEAALGETLEVGDRLERRRGNSESQGSGATLVLVLGTTAITAVAEGIRTWLARNGGVSIEIAVGSSTVRARNLDDQGVRALVKVIAGATGDRSTGRLGPGPAAGGSEKSMGVADGRVVHEMRCDSWRR